jgi:hypothetical protein
VVARVKDRKLMVGVFLEESRRVGWDGNRLSLAADEVHRSLLEARENRELLGEILKTAYGRPVTVRFVDKKEAPAAARRAAVLAPAPPPSAAPPLAAPPSASTPETGRVRVVRPTAPAAPAPAPLAAALAAVAPEPSAAPAAAVAPEPSAAPAPAVAPEPSAGPEPPAAPPSGGNGGEGAALSPEVREAMLWFEGEIIRRPDSGGIAP